MASDRSGGGAADRGGERVARVGERLDSTDMPATGIAAEEQAGRAQRRYLALMRAQISLPLVGVGVGAASKLSSHLAVLGIVASATAAAVAVLRAIQRSNHFDTAWYEARATAEEVKSLAWCYAVWGPPFDRRDEQEVDTDERVVQELERLTDDRDFLDPPDPSGEITVAMRRLRYDSEESVRRGAYLQSRVDVQHEWYADKARRNMRVASRWDVVFYVVIAAAVVAGAYLAADHGYSGRLGPLVSVATGSAGAVVAWSALRRYTSLAASYRAVARQLSLLASIGRSECTAEEWAEFVGKIEDVIMLEQAQWRTTRR